MCRGTEASDNDTPATKGKVAAPAPKKPVKSKWEGEDEEDDAPVVRSFNGIHL